MVSCRIQLDTSCRNLSTQLWYGGKKWLKTSAIGPEIRLTGNIWELIFKTGERREYFLQRGLEGFQFPQELNRHPVFVLYDPLDYCRTGKSQGVPLPSKIRRQE
jgi:hypothetical protein